jgi:hypothetical protein
VPALLDMSRARVSRNLKVDRKDETLALLSPYTGLARLSVKRRSFLQGAGVVTVVVVGGVWRAYDQGVFSVGEGPAYEPWKTWRTCLSYRIV